jgi:hypothetical protein
MTNDEFVRRVETLCPEDQHVMLALIEGVYEHETTGQPAAYIAMGALLALSLTLIVW